MRIGIYKDTLAARRGADIAVSNPANRGARVWEYAAGLVRLMSDADYRHALGSRCRSYCTEHCARAKIRDRWEELLFATQATRTSH